jgi:nicotinamidase-related amidase
MAEKALIVVDMLNDFIDEKGALYCGKEGEAIVPFIKERLAAARECGDLVVFVTDAHDEDDVEFRRYPRHAVAGSWGGEIVPELAPALGERVIRKKTLNAFYGTDLERFLAEAGVRTAEVVGVCTSICVMDLVADLAARGYDIIVPVRGVADFDQEFHKFALRRMARVYGADVS